MLPKQLKSYKRILFTFSENADKELRNKGLNDGDAPGFEWTLTFDLPQVIGREAWVPFGMT